MKCIFIIDEKIPREIITSKKATNIITYDNIKNEIKKKKNMSIPYFYSNIPADFINSLFNDIYMNFYIFDENDCCYNTITLDKTRLRNIHFEILLGNGRIARIIEFYSKIPDEFIESEDDTEPSLIAKMQFVNLFSSKDKKHRYSNYGELNFHTVNQAIKAWERNKWIESLILSQINKFSGVDFDGDVLNVVPYKSYIGPSFSPIMGGNWLSAFGKANYGAASGIRPSFLIGGGDK